MSKKEAELIIRAKDEAKKTLTEATAALKALVGAQDDLGRSAAKTDTLLGRLGAEFTTLNKEIQGLSALAKVSAQLDTAANGIARLESTLKRSKGNTAELVDQYGKLAVVTGQLRQQAALTADALARQTQSTKSAKTELTQANAEVRKAEASYKSLYTQLQKVKEPNETLRQKYREQRDGLIGLHTAQEKANRNYEAQVSELKATKLANTELATALKAAETQQDKLRSQAVRATTALAGQRAELAKSKAEMASVSATVAATGKSLGATATDQATISKAAERAAADLNKVTTALERQRAAQNQATTTTAPISTSEVAKQSAAYRAQMQAVQQSKAAFREAQIEAGKLGAAMKAAAAPTRELETAYTLAQASIQSTRAEMNRQVATLDDLRKKTRTFIDFQKAASQTVRGTAGVATGEFFKLDAAAKKQGDSLGQTASGAQQARSAFAAMNAEGRQSLSLYQRLRGELLALTASYVGLYAAINQIQSVVGAFQSLEAVQSRLGVAFEQNTRLISNEVSFLREEAIRLGISFEVLGNEYSKFTVATSAANFSMEDTRKIFLSVAEAARVNKLSTEQLSGVFLALQQMISKGKVSSEELRRQLGDRLTGAFHLFAAGLKMTTAELDAALRKGEIFASDTTMLAFADELNSKFGKQLPTALESLTTQLGRFDALLFDMKIRIAQGGFADALRVSIDEINQTLQSDETAGFIQTTSDALVGLVKAIKFVVQNFDIFIAIGKVFIAIKLAQTFGSMVTAITNMNRALVETVVRTKAAQGSLAGMVGPGVNAALSSLTGTIAAANIQLGVLPARSIAARAGLAALIAGATTLRAVFITLAATARALWVAIGGLPGLILTGVTLIVSSLVGEWTSGVEEATNALEEHKKLLESVQNAYRNAEGDVKKFNDSLAGLTAAKADINLKALRRELEEIQKNTDTAGFAMFRAGAGQYNRVISQINQLVHAFRDGKISAEDFTKKIEALYNANKNVSGLDEVAAGYLKIAEKAKETETAIKEAEAVQRVAAGTMKDTDRAALGVADAVELSGEKFKDAAAETAKYNAVIDELKKLVPELKEEMDRLGEIQAIDKMVEGFKDMKLSAEQMKTALELAGRARDAINTKADDKLISSGSLADRIAGVESGGNPNAKNPLSTATGLGQFIESTWLRMFKQYFPTQAAGMTDAAILELRKNAEISKNMIELYAAENAKAFRAAGIAVNDAALYLGHFLGPGGAAAVLKAKPDTPVDQVLGQGQINANKSILEGKTAAEVVAWAEKKVGISERELEISKELNDLDTKKAEKAKEFHDSVAGDIAQKQNELTLLSQEARQREITKAIQEAETEAKKAGTVLTKEEVALLTEKTGKLWDANNLETIANGLMEKRAALLDKMRVATQQGDTDKVAELNLKLTDINTKLQDSINKGIAFWTAIGGADAQAKLETLKAMNAEISKTPSKVDAAKAATNSMAETINQNLADGLMGAFDSFAQAVASGENVFTALKNSFLQFASTFLQQIAKMILQQAILNALGMSSGGANTGGVGGGIAGMIAGLFHEGGVVGVGGGTRVASPSMFKNALRYHGGGIAGLRPNEVPAILEKGEEVLTAGDPRHAMNGGGGAAAPNIKVVNTIDAGSFVSEGLNSPVGEKAFMNFIQANQGAVRSAIGV